MKEIKNTLLEDYIVPDNIDYLFIRDTNSIYDYCIYKDCIIIYQREHLSDNFNTEIYIARNKIDKTNNNKIILNNTLNYLCKNLIRKVRISYKKVSILI